MSYKTQMVDLSSNNPIPDLDRLWRTGMRVLCLKVSEAENYAWADHLALARRWHAKGGIVLHYHFLRPPARGELDKISGVHQADWFWQNVKSVIGPGDRPVVDVEVAGLDPAQVREYIERMHDHWPVTGLIYGPPYFLRDHKIKPTRGWWLWVADYSKQVTFVPPGWIRWTAWQYTDHGAAPGLALPGDMSVIHRELLEPTLHQGDRCFAVLDLKHLLHQAGYRGMALHNNRYGPGTRRAVARFKREHPHIGSTSGGIAGRRTWHALHRQSH